ncbi:hypothetical protein [Nonomuraea longicatena]|uniref:Uncharacterized protein n=1 Tax=Nonomuraea longicatena TaxID=83682 RepID=A0ABN1P6V4_9ACTN
METTDAGQSGGRVASAADTEQSGGSGASAPDAEQDGGSGRGAVRRATALAGLGSVADVAALAQLLTTESRHGVLVAGLLSVLAGTLGLVQLYGRPVRLRAGVMVALIAVGSGLTGAMIEHYRAEAAPVPPPAAATPLPSSPSVTPSPLSPSPSVTPSPLSPSPSVTPSPLSPSPSVTPPPAPSSTATVSRGATASRGAAVPTARTSPSGGEVLREAEAALRDQDYLDVESGAIGTIDPAASDLWYVSPYRALWTAGGGRYPITPVDAHPGPAACARALKARRYDQVAVGERAPGDWACARTAEGNLVAIRFPAIPAADAPLKISYIVWHRSPEE